VLADAPLAYTLVEGYQCFIVLVLPRVMGLLCLPSKFTEIMKGFDLSQAVMATVLDRLWRAGGLLPPLFAPERDVQVLRLHRRWYLPSLLLRSQGMIGEQLHCFLVDVDLVD
jgi:hypothetical protein